MNKNFNIVITGTGGQGLITLLKIISEAALLEGYDIKTSELHGLSQRGGSVEVHIRFGKKIYSPLVAKNKADLVIGLEMQEILRAINFANSKTVFLINQHIIPIPLEKPVPQEQIIKKLKMQSKNILLVPASQICQQEFGKSVTAGIYLLSLASFKGIIPLKPQSMLSAIKQIIPKKYFEQNKKTFELAEENGKKK